tara:strand:- start:4639 stop:5457 length:819 start_codon:yes stop_codon:yes gene_type:complete
MKGDSYGVPVNQITVKLLLLFILLSFSLLSCGVIQASDATPVFPRTSFIFIEKKLLLHQCGTFQCREKQMSSVASGFIVKITPHGSYGITAGHVCENSYPILQPPIQKLSNIFVLTLMEKKYRAVVLTYNMESDLCLLYIDGLTKGIKALDVSEDPPRAGDKVYNLAAPRGIFIENMVPIFEGRYNGEGSPFAFYSLPAAGGSSGSMIINSDGEVVGMVHSVYVRFPNIILSPTYTDLYRFVHYNLYKYEKYRAVMEDLELKNIFIPKERVL